MVQVKISLQAVMSRLDPGLSKWKGSVLRCHNVAQLSLLKIELEVSWSGEVGHFKISTLRKTKLITTNLLSNLSKCGGQ